MQSDLVKLDVRVCTIRADMPAQNRVPEFRLLEDDDGLNIAKHENVIYNQKRRESLNIVGKGEWLNN